MTATAASRMPVSLNGVNTATWRANTTAPAAMIPECIVQNIAQPHKNPTPGE